MSSRRTSAVDLGLGQRLVRALSVADSDAAATAGVLAEVAQSLGAPLAVLWRFDATTGLLHWGQDWAASDDLETLRHVDRRLSFAPGVGLPGRVLQAGRPAWVEDIAADANFPRAEMALRTGLRSALAGPLTSPAGIVGVIEFFGPSRTAPAAEQLDAVATAGSQLAAYLGRREIEHRLLASEEFNASIFDAALDCIITMDDRGRIVDLNPAAEATFGYARDTAIGELLSDLIIPREFRDAHRRALSEYVKHRNKTILGRRLELIGQRSDGSTFPVELTVTRLGTREPPLFAGFLRDITERRAAEEQLGRLLEREQAERARATQAERAAREVAQALQRSLLPPRLPAIDGFELGAVYRAGTEGWDVGGDFYDVFKVGSGRWALAIGDVRGKGPPAASLTGLVRYALRIAAVRENSPSAVLETVNDELLRDTSGDFCTVIFALLDLEGDERRVRMAVGGHPLPLLARPGATVEAVGRPGTLLGAFRDVALHDSELRLRADERLLFYTDGLTEARTPDGRFGDARLSALLAEAGDLHPQLLVERLDAALLAARSPGTADDVALLALTADGVTVEGGERSGARPT